MPIPSLDIFIRDPGLGLIDGPDPRAVMVIGPTSLGVANRVYSYQQIPDLVTNLGSGPGVEQVALGLNAPNHGTWYLCKPATSIAGSNSAVTAAPTGGPAVTVTGTPLDSYEFIAKVVTGGAVGAAAFQWSLDGGDNFSEAITVVASYPVQGTGLTLQFAAGTYVAGTTYSFTSTPPFMTVADLNSAMDACVSSGVPDFGLLRIVGATATAADMATLIAAVQTKLDDFAQNKKRWMRCLVDAPDVTDTALVTAFANTVAPRVCPSGGLAEITSAISGRSHKRAAGFAVAARAGSVPLSEHFGRVATGALQGVTRLYRDETDTPVLDAARITTLRTWPRRQGAYITRARLLGSAGSDYRQLQYGRIIDAACAAAYDKLLVYINDAVRVYGPGDPKAGMIHESDARAIDAELEKALADQLINTTPRHVSAVRARVVRTDNLISTSTLRAEIGVAPKGYLEFIIAMIGLVNPAVMQLQAA